MELLSGIHSASGCDINLRCEKLNLVAEFYSVFHNFGKNPGLRLKRAKLFGASGIGPLPLTLVSSPFLVLSAFQCLHASVQTFSKNAGSSIHSEPRMPTPTVVGTDSLKQVGTGSYGARSRWQSEAAQMPICAEFRARFHFAFCPKQL